MRGVGGWFRIFIFETCWSDNLLSTTSGQGYLFLFYTENSNITGGIAVDAAKSPLSHENTSGIMLTLFHRMSGSSRRNRKS